MKTEHSRSQFTFYASYFNAVDRLPKSRRAEAFYAIVLYALDGIEPEGLSAGVDGVFEACRPNIDSGRSKAEIAKSAKFKMQNEDDDCCKNKEKTKGKIKTKTKIKSESEEERKTETEDQTEGTPVGAADISPARRTQQSGGLLGDSLPLSQLVCDNWHPQAGGPASRPVEGCRPQEAKAMESTVRAGAFDSPQSEPAGTGLPAPSLPEKKEKNTVFFGTAPPEQREPYAEMFRADPILASAWRDLLAPGPGVRPLGNAEREPLLARLRAAPEWERLAILSDRLGSPLSRDWQTLRRRAGI